MPPVSLVARVLAIALASAGTTSRSPFPPPAQTPADPAGAQRPAVIGSGASVSGRLTTADDAPLTSGTLIMRSLEGDGVTSLAPDDVRLLPDGRFEFRRVPPGRYEIRARGETAARRALVAVFRITVSERDVTNLQLRLIPGATIAGRIEVDPGEAGALPAFPGLRVRASFADGSRFGDVVSRAVASDGSFTMEGLMSGSHLVTVDGVPGPWVVTRVLHRGRDVADSGIEVEAREHYDNVRIMLSRVASEVTGVVLDGAGAGVDGATVIVFSADAMRWNPASRRMRMSRTDATGRYRIRGLPSGEYRIAAALIEESALERPGAFQSLAASAAAGTITHGEPRTVDVRLASPAAPEQPSVRG